MKGYTCEGVNAQAYPRASEAQQQRLCADSAAATAASKHLPRCKGCDGTQQFQQRLLRALMAAAHTPGVGVGALPRGVQCCWLRHQVTKVHGGAVCHINNTSCRAIWGNIFLSACLSADGQRADHMVLPTSANALSDATTLTFRSI
jgi:hypothetical protein